MNSQLSAMTIIGVPAEAYGFGSTYMMAITPLMVLIAVFLNYAILPVYYNTQIDSCYSVIWREQISTMIYVNYELRISF